MVVYFQPCVQRFPGKILRTLVNDLQLEHTSWVTQTGLQYLS